MKNAKNFRLNPAQAELLSNSFNDFKNDAIKEITTDYIVGGRTKTIITIIKGFTKIVVIQY